GEHEHVAQRRAHRRKTTADVAGQIFPYGVHAFGDLLPGPVDVGALGEIQRDGTERIFGNRTQDVLLRNAEQFDLYRLRDQRLDFFRRHAGRLDDDLDLGRRNVGKGVD